MLFPGDPMGIEIGGYGMKIGRSSLAVAAAFTIGATTAGGIALAAGSDNEVNACINSVTRAVRIPKAGAACNALEESISWNKQGAPGAPGAPGANGAAGATGATGPQGPSGAGYMATLGMSPTEAVLSGDDCANGAVRDGFIPQNQLQSTYLPAGDYVVSHSVQTTLAPQQRGDVSGKAEVEIVVASLTGDRTFAFAEKWIVTGVNGDSVTESGFAPFHLDEPTSVMIYATSAVNNCGRAATGVGAVTFVKVR